MPTSGEFAGQRLTQFQRLFSDISLHVMSLRFGDFRVGTTDFVFVTWIHSRGEEATTRFEAQRVCQNANFDAHAKVRQNG